MAVKNTPGHCPFTVTAHLRTGIALNGEYDLDLAGLVATQLRAIQRAKSYQAGTLYTEPLPDTTEDTVYDMDLPFTRCVTRDGIWHWAASCAILPTPAEQKQNNMLYKSLDDNWAFRAAKRPLPYYHPYSGSYRDIMMNSATTIVNKVTWRAIGEIQTIESLLRPIHFIGKRRSVGEGAVLSWEVTPEKPTDLERWVHAEGDTILRPIPIGCAIRLGIAYDTIHHGIRPPVWHPDLLEELAITKDTNDDWFD